MRLRKVSNPHAVILGLLAGLLVIRFLLKKNYPNESELLSYITLGIAVLSALFRTFASLLASLWMAFGFALGKINGAILLTLVYFFLLTPLSLLRKLLSPSDSFVRNKGTHSKFINREHTFDKRDLQYPW